MIIQLEHSLKISLEFDPELIEKHFTISRKLPGRDNKFAILPNELYEIKKYIENKGKKISNLAWR